MSSEQVIAGLARACDEWEAEAAMRGGNAGRLALRRCAETVREYLKLADRLSTPAAGGDDVPEYSQGVMGDGAAILRDGVPMTVDDIVGTLNQLQARNAEQAERIATLRETADRATGRADEAHAKLTALLAGIEGLEKELRDEFFATRVVAFFVTKLKALREKANG